MLPVLPELPEVPELPEFSEPKKYFIYTLKV